MPLVLTPYTRDSKIEVQHEKENKEFSCLREKEITAPVVRERVGSAVPSALGGRECLSGARCSLPRGSSGTATAGSSAPHPDLAAACAP